jgi:para-nitrobenzyl esterase
MARFIATTATATALATVVLAVPAATPAEARRRIPTGTTITLEDGVVHGAVVGRSRAFLGIPFAAPPVGSLRWRPPAPVVPWEGVLDATSFAGACPQLPALVGSPSENEDCLYLNVWTPEPAPRRLRPVMVWIHGGSNVSGSAADVVPFPGFEGFLYDGSVLAGEHDVVVVSMNYRLGVFGFFGHADLAGEDPDFPHGGNQGLLDQQAALAWVRDNVAAFGGDPRKVTIFGESAGAFDVCAHVVSPMSRGLFRGAISQSGACTVGVATAAESAAAAGAVADAVGCAAAPDELACLRAAPVADLLAAGEDALAGNALGISIDGGFLPDDPRTLIANRQFDKRVRYILGANSDEGTIFFLGATPVTTEAEYLAALTESWGDLADDIAAVYPVGAFETPQDALVRVFGDAVLLCPTYDLARRFTAARGRAWVYNFNRVIPVDVIELLGLGALHGAEIAYVFGAIEAPTAEDAALGLAIRDYWSTFATKRMPRARRAPSWKPYRARRDNILRLDATIEELRGFRRTECDFWASVADRR